MFLYSKYLSDPTEEVATATENLLADFLKEIREIANINKKRKERMEAKRIADRLERERFAIMSPTTNGKQPGPEVMLTDSGTIVTAGEAGADITSSPVKEKADVEVIEERDTGGRCLHYVGFISINFRLTAWIPGQGVVIDHAAIVEILIKQLDGERE